MIIAIDGPAGSGKSTVARSVAARLGLVFLDTGAMYRAVTLAVQRRGVDPDDGEACARVASALELTFDDDGQVWIDGQPGEPEIRSTAVTRDVSAVAAHPGVRRAIVPIQRAIAAQRGAVAEGRDTTTVVFPNADHKFFLIASSRERARRRAMQSGTPERIAQIRRAIEQRDQADSTRKDSPLIEAADACRIDTDAMSVEQVVETILSRVSSAERP